MKFICSLVLLPPLICRTFHDHDASNIMVFCHRKVEVLKLKLSLRGYWEDYMSRVP